MTTVPAIVPFLRDPSWLLVCLPSGEEKNKYDRRWFFFTLRLQVAPSLGDIRKIRLSDSLYIETTAKVDWIHGETTLIIVDSPQIGFVKAKQVVLCNSRAQTVEADAVWLFASKVNQLVAKTTSTWPSPDDAEPRRSKMKLFAIKKSNLLG